MDIMSELEKAGSVLLDRHFVYKSGKHGSGYINMDPIFPDIKLMQQLGIGLWSPFVGTAFDTIATPATGGIALAYATAHSLHYEVDVGSGGPVADVVWADKNGENFAFERDGFISRLTGKRVLIVEDLLTTGGSVIKVCREAERFGADIVGVSAICNRGGVTAADLGVRRLESLLDVSFEAIEADSCPLCEQAVPIVLDIGHARKFQQEHPDYLGGFYELLAA